MMISGFDKFMLRLTPHWWLGRMSARAAAETMVRHYEAAQPGRRTQNWARSFSDADLNIRGASIELRMHARDLIRNNSWARRAQRVIANNTAGWGIVPSAVGPQADKAELLWKAWAETTDCETEGRHTFYGLQHLAMKSIAESGEVLFRRRWRRPKDALALPLQIQVLEADYLDHSKNLFDSQAGGPIIQGVELDKIGRRAAYWLYEKHPGSGRNYNPSKRIPASEVIHVYYIERPGQTRGVSWFAPAIVGLKDFDEYEDATLLRQKIAACFAAFVTDLDGSSSAFGVPTDDPVLESLEPGMIAKLPPGKDVKFGNPPPVNDDGFATRNLRRIATAMGITYEDMSGDYSQVNFSSARMARIAHQGNVHDWRWNMLIPQLCEGVWQWAMEAAVFAEELAQVEVPRVEWTEPPLPMLEPDKEGLAYQRMVRTGMMTFSQMIREQGRNPKQQFAEYAADYKTLDSLGLKLDSDVRAVNSQGQEQPPDPTESSAAEPPESESTKKTRALEDLFVEKSLALVDKINRGNQ